MCDFKIETPPDNRNGGGVNAPCQCRDDQPSIAHQMAANQSSFEPQPGPSHECESPEEVNLLSTENLDRSSPELWPDKVPGVNSILSQFRTDDNYAACWEKEITKEDIEEMYKLSKLSRGAIIAEVKKLHDLAYQLGQEEAKEMTRGKYLDIFEDKSQCKAHI